MRRLDRLAAVAVGLATALVIGFVALPILAIFLRVPASTLLTELPSTEAVAASASSGGRLRGVSRTLGAGRTETLCRVAVPMAGQGLSAGAALAWARALGEFGATILFAGSLQGKTQTLPLAIFSRFSSG